jgi:mRNA interferase MazF
MVGYVPDRGHLVWINFNPAVGREQQGRRPAIILSPKSIRSLAKLKQFAAFGYRLFAFRNRRW